MFARLREAILELDPQRANALLGPRQTGKTTLLRQIARHFLEQGWPPANVLYFDFKDDRFDHTHGLREILEAKTSGLREDHPRLLLLDEVTHAPRWDVALKQVVDAARGVPGGRRDRVLVTDSAAALMRRGTSDSLQGRIDQTRIHGLTFEEALRIQSLGSESERDVFLRLPGALERFLARGGLPEHLTTDHPESAWERIRRDVTDGAIARDLSHDHNVDVERITALFRHIVQESGALFEANNRARDMQAEGEKGPDARTVRRWVGLLQQACLLEGLGPWNPGLRKGVNKPSRALKVRQKLYAEDHGLVLAFSPFASPLSNDLVRARVYETVVFTHLRALRDGRGTFKLYYFREQDEMEIDFVLEFEDVVIGMEVTSSKSPKKKLKGIGRVADRAGLDRVIIVHGGPGAPQESDSCATWPLDAFLLNPSTCIDESLEWTRKFR